jgi:hypothetical protein
MTRSYSALPFVWLGYIGNGSPFSPIGVINKEKLPSTSLRYMAEMNSSRYIAPRKGSVDTRANAVIQMLCEIGADIDLTDLVGNAPLH